MKKVRCCVFETNSSSTHSICITKRKNHIEFPEHLSFKQGEFGWEENCLSTPEEKASYLYQAILDTKDAKEIEYYENILYDELGKRGVDADFEKGKKDEYGFDYGYVDHPYRLLDWIDWMFDNPTRIIKFLFSDESFVLTGNDNDDDNVDIDVPYKCDVFYKDN